MMLEKHKILFIEDDDSVRGLFKAILSDHYEVVVASSGTEALALLENHRVDGIISDYQMPKMNGLEFVQLLRLDHRWHKLPVVMMSGSFTREIVSEATGAGVSRCLSKPFTTETLKEVVHEMLSGLP